MEKPRMIKSIVPYVCPHCSHEIDVCFSFIPPGLSWIITKEEMERNKRKLKETLKVITFKNEAAQKEVMDWIDSDDCVLGAEDIDDLAKSIADEQKK